MTRAELRWVRSHDAASSVSSRSLVACSVMSPHDEKIDEVLNKRVKHPQLDKKSTLIISVLSVLKWSESEVERSIIRFTTSCFMIQIYL